MFAELRRCHVRLGRPVMFIRAAQGRTHWCSSLDLGSCRLILDMLLATRWSGIEEGDGQEQAEKVSLTKRRVQVGVTDRILGLAVCNNISHRPTPRWYRPSRLLPSSRFRHTPHTPPSPTAGSIHGRCTSLSLTLAFLAPGPRFSLFSIASIPSTPSSSHIWKHLVRALTRRRVESSSCTTSLKYRRHEQRPDKAYLFSLSGNFCCLISLLSIGVALHQCIYAQL